MRLPFLTYDMKSEQIAESKNRDAIILHKTEYWQAFGADARILGEELGLTVLRDPQGGFVTGFPAEKFDVVVAQLVKANYRVCVAAQDD